MTHGTYFLGFIIAIIVFLIPSMINDAFAQPEPTTPESTSILPSEVPSTLPSIVPPWIKSNADWWAQGLITDHEFVNGVEFLVKERIIKSPRIEIIDDSDLPGMKLNGKEFDLPKSRGLKTEVKFSGKILDYLRGTDVIILIERPDGQTDELRTIAAKSGDYQNLIYLEKEWSPGEYTIKVKYGKKIVDSASFKVKGEIKLEEKKEEKITDVTNNITISAKEFEQPKSRGIINTVDITGYVAGYKKGADIILEIQRPDKQIDEQRIMGNRGDYNTRIMLNNEFPIGEYNVSTIYKKNKINTASFFVTYEKPSLQNNSPVTNRSTIEIKNEEPKPEYVIVENLEIPPWIKNTAGWWASDEISENDFISGIEFMITEGIIKTPTLKVVDEPLITEPEEEFPELDEPLEINIDTFSGDERTRKYQLHSLNKLALSMLGDIKTYEGEFLKDTANEAWHYHAQTKNKKLLDDARKLDDGEVQTKQDIFAVKADLLASERGVNDEEFAALQSGVKISDLDSALELIKEKFPTTTINSQKSLDAAYKQASLIQEAFKTLRQEFGMYSVNEPLSYGLLRNGALNEMKIAYEMLESNYYGTKELEK